MYLWFVVGVLLLTSMLSFLDRQVLSLLVAPLQAEFQIGDAQVGLLLGGVFGLAYVLAGLPLSYVADRGHRRNLIIAGLLFWSLATAATALSRSFGDLLLARAALAIGEAALAPAAYSLIAAYAPPHQAARATSVYSLGVYLGAGAAVLIGGVLLQMIESGAYWTLPVIGAVQPWQAVLLLLASAGPALALLLLAVREPPRTVPASQAGSAQWTLLRGRWSVILLLASGFALMGMSGYASSAWLPSYFVRTHGWSVATFGMTYGIIISVFGGAGVLFGGWLADRWTAAGHRDAVLRVGLLASAGSVVFGLWFLLPIDGRVAAAFIAPSTFTIAMTGGLWAAGLRQLVPVVMIGRATALCLMIMTLAGLGLGPTLVGWLSHAFFKGDGSLAMPLLLVCGGSQILGGVALWAARRPYLSAISISS
nr:MFS transporter [Solimonas sp. SE-A11]